MLFNWCNNRRCYDVPIERWEQMSILTDEYFHLKARICIKVGCNNCPLTRRERSRFIKCNTLEREKPDEAIRIVKKWSEEND